MRAQGYDGFAEKYMFVSIDATATPFNGRYTAIRKNNVSLELTTVPEPSTYALIGGCLALGFF